MSEQKVTFFRIVGRQINYINFFANLIPKFNTIVDVSVVAAAVPGRHWCTAKITSLEDTEPLSILLSFARRSRFRIELY